MPRTRLDLKRCECGRRISKGPYERCSICRYVLQRLTGEHEPSLDPEHEKRILAHRDRVQAELNAIRARNHTEKTS